MDVEQVYYPLLLVLWVLRKLNSHVIGIEIDPSAIEIFKNNIQAFEIDNIDIIQADVTAIQLKENVIVI